MEKGFENKSYESHINQKIGLMANDDQKMLAETWFDKNTVDYWRHKRMYDLLIPILKSYPGTTWLTVGDGRNGTDANYLKCHGFKVLATDITDLLLSKSAKTGFIDSYKMENAEKLSFENESFDFVFCKESYHHFPRPMIALYEMLRVCKEGVVLIEPNDLFIFQEIQKLLIYSIRTAIKKILGKKNEYHSFEPIGNYIYTLSKREIEKVAVAMNFPYLAFKGINDFYIKGAEYEPFNNQSEFFKKINKKIAYLDFLCKIGLKNYSLLAVVIFKRKPGNDCLANLKKISFDVIPLPKNPYLGVAKKY